MTADYRAAEWTPSPNYWAGRAGYEPQYIVCHGTDGSFPGCQDWLCSPQSGASVHYIVARSGHLAQLVREHDTAWGNGIPEPPSRFCGGVNPNRITLSIEHERTGGNTSAVTKEQREASAALVADIRSRWGHLPLIPHSEISPVSRAHCPGPNFPMPAIDGPVQQAVRGVTYVRFGGTVQHTPLIFYHDWSFARPAYVSVAQMGLPLVFDSWTYGPPVRDTKTGQDDRRWFHRLNPHGRCGWCPSAWINGVPPGCSP